jgi:hypothetical protein
MGEEARHSQLKAKEPLSGLRLLGMALSPFWLRYRHNNQISVVIEPGSSLIHARMRASLANLGEGEFTEGQNLIAGGECRRRCGGIPPTFTSLYLFLTKYFFPAR